MDPITLIEGASSALGIAAIIWGFLKRKTLALKYHNWMKTPAGKSALDRLESSVNNQAELINTQDGLITGLQTAVHEEQRRRTDCETNIAHLTQRHEDLITRHEDLKELVTSKAAVELLAGSVGDLNQRVETLTHAIHNGFAEVLKRSKAT